MKKLFIFGFLIIAASLIFSDYSLPTSDSLKLNKTELVNFLGEESSTATDFGEQSVTLTKDKDFETVSQQASQNEVTTEDVAMIRQGLADSFKMKLEEIEITVERESTASFATGYVNIGEADNGGIYFAARTESGWEIAHDGTGIIECAGISKYNFPAGLIPRCFDSETGISVDR